MSNMVRLIKHVWRKSSLYIIRKRKVIIVSLINAVFLVFATYFINNWSILTGENLKLYAGLEFIKDIVSEKASANDSVFLVNVSYDKQLANKKIDGLVVGNTDVTNRKDLIRLLQAVKKEANYRYIFLDIRFEKGEETEFDDELFEEIINTPRLVIANHEDIELADHKLEKKAAFSDYLITYTSTNFVRFKFLRPLGESMPLRAYRELYHDNIIKHGWFYICNYGLCQNTYAVKSPIECIANEWKLLDDNSAMKNIPYYDLSRINNEENLSILTNGKYIVVGNMIDDIHDTFYGQTPGSIIVFGAFWALKNGCHVVEPWVEILLFLTFFCVSLSLFRRKSVLECLPFMGKSKSKFIHFIITFLTYSTVFMLLTVFLYMSFDYITSILGPVFYFSIQKEIITYKRMKL